MFALLISAIVALGGALLFMVLSGSSFEAMQGPPIAITVIGALILLYLLSHHSNERRSGRLPAIIALGVIAVVGAITTRVDPAPIIKNFFAAAQRECLHKGPFQDSVEFIEYLAFRPKKALQVLHPFKVGNHHSSGIA